MFFKRFLTFPTFKLYFIERLNYVCFDVKALRVTIVVFCSVIPYSLLDANISEEPAATIVTVEEIEHFCSVCPSCCIVLGRLNHEDRMVGHIVAGSQNEEHFCLKRCKM